MIRLTFSLAAIFIFVGCHGKSLPNDQESFLIDCLNQRNNMDWIKSLSDPAKAKQCLRFLKSLRSASTANSSVEDESPMETKINTYFQALISWRNEESSLAGLLINKVAPCSFHSRDLKQYWTEFFLKRRRTAAVAPAVLGQEWAENKGEIVIGPSNSRYSPDRLVAAELILSRVSPNKIRESFGRYQTSVTFSDNDWLMLHSDFQSSCPSNSGDMIVLELDIKKIRQWYREGTGNITFSVQVNPRRQYFFLPYSDAFMNTYSTEDQRRVHVVKNILGMVLHYQRSRSDDTYARQNLLAALKKSFANVTTQDTNEEIEQTSDVIPQPHHFSGIRWRRSPGSAPTQQSNGRETVVDAPRPLKINKPCHLASFILRNEITESLNVSWPAHGPHYWDIAECVGRCDNLSSPDDMPMHAVAMNTDSRGDVCCVPLRYRSQFYAVQIEGTLRTEEVENMVVRECGCR